LAADLAADAASAAAPGRAELVTDSFDMQVRGLKTINAVEVALSGWSAPAVSIFYRLASAAPFAQTSWVPLNRDGWARINIVGTDFRVAFRGTPEANAQLDYVTVKWQASDRRNLRGPYGATNMGQEL
jgi:hypothetical protein